MFLYYYYLFNYFTPLLGLKFYFGYSTVVGGEWINTSKNIFLVKLYIITKSSVILDK